MSDADASDRPASRRFQPRLIVLLVGLWVVIGVVVWRYPPFVGGEEQVQGREPVVLGEAFDLTGLTIDRGKLRSGGPGKDGIPALTAPKTTPVAEADFLPGDARVIGVVVEGEARAYPIPSLSRTAGSTSPRSGFRPTRR